jgi:glucosamine-6-phosphate deaminase
VRTHIFLVGCSICSTFAAIMKVFIYKTKEELGATAARKGAELIRKAIGEKGEATIIVATGASQFEMLDELVHAKVDWTRVTAFHLDEYIGIPVTHGASFRKYLKERFVDRVPLKDFHYINGESDAETECERLGELIASQPVDVAFIGIGENGHLAFNDPPADFKTEEAYIKVNLDLECRNQQFGEGWFPTLDQVPETAISMSVNQILKSENIICSVPDERKAEAVKKAVEKEVCPEIPASALKTHKKTWLFLDSGSSSLLRRI